MSRSLERTSAAERVGLLRTPCQNLASSGVSYRPSGFLGAIQAISA